MELRDQVAMKEEEVRSQQEKTLAVIKEAQEARHLRDELDCVQQKVPSLPHFGSFFLFGVTFPILRYFLGIKVPTIHF